MVKLVRFVICIYRDKNLFLVLISIVSSRWCAHHLTGAQNLFLATVEGMLLLGKFGREGLTLRSSWYL